MRPVENPIPRSSFFVTPSSLQDVVDVIERIPTAQRAEAYLAVQMALNWANQEVEDKILSREIFAC